MGAQEGQHLSGSEFDLLVLRESKVEFAPEIDADYLRILKRHLQSCASCRAKLAVHQEIQRELIELCAEGNAPEYPETCPNVDWVKCVAGLLTVADTEKLLAHASSCAKCGPLLKEASEAVAAPEETALLELECFQSQWRAYLAGRLANASQAKRRGTIGRWLALRSTYRNWHAAVFVAGVAAVLLALVLFIQPHLKSPDQLLAIAYTQNRTVELRIPGARFGPLRVQRGATARATALFEARVLISQRLDANPSDPALLGASARADLLEWRYESAIETLKRALDKRPRWVPLLVDLGSAYCERADATSSPADYATALEWLGEALSLQPDDAITLFNTAVVQERLEMNEQATETWRKFLVSERDQLWASEGRDRLEALLQKTNRHRSNLSGPLLSPSVFAQTRQELFSGAIRWRIEDYLQNALADWLPRLVSPQTAKRDAAVISTALRKLSRVLVTNNSDFLLHDFLLSGHSSASIKQHINERAMWQLSTAIQAKSRLELTTADESAARAVALFAQAGNHPGELAALVERANASYGTGQFTTCVSLARRALAGPRIDMYPWLEARALLARASCLEALSDFPARDRDVRRAFRISSTAHLSTVALRVRSASATAALDRGDEIAGWRLSVEGLRDYWVGVSSPLLAYDFCTSLAYFTQTEERWELSRFEWLEALAALSDQHLPLLEATVRQHLAAVQQQRGQYGDAILQLTRATNLYSELPDNRTTTDRKSSALIRLAYAEIQANRIRDARLHLQEVTPESLSRLDSTSRVLFHQAWGRLYLKFATYPAAKSELGRAVDEAEHGPSSDWMEADSAVHDLVRLQLTGNHKPELALLTWEAWRATLAGTRSATEQLVEQRRVQLKKATVVSYARFADAIAIWVFDDRGVGFRLVPIDAEHFDRVVNDFVDQCSNRTSDRRALARNAQILYHWLIEPVDSYLSPERDLFIEPDRSFENLPFAALADATEHPLVSKWRLAVCLGPHPGTGEIAEHISRNLHSLVIGVGNASGDSESRLPAIDSSVREARLVASHFVSPTLLVGNTTTPLAVLRRLPQSQIFHFSGHAPTNTAESALLLTPSTVDRSPPEGDLLYPEAIRTRQLSDCRLVVLSACSTAKNISGASTTAGFVPAFIGIGAGHVIASHWSVDSESTCAFISRMYDSLLAGNSITSALKAASEATLLSGNTSHPYYWAAFSAFRQY